MLSELRRYRLADASGRRAALQDLAVDLRSGDYPAVTWLVYRAPGDRRPRDERRLLPWNAVSGFDPARRRIETPDLAAGVRLTGEALDRAILLVRDVVDSLLLDLPRRRATRANDLLLERDGETGPLRLRAADTGLYGALRLASGGRLGGGTAGRLLDWQNVEFLRGDPQAVHAGADYHRRLERLQPAEIARLVTRLPYWHAVELLLLLPERVASDVLEALPLDRGAQAFYELDEGVAARLIAGMAPDRAADLLGCLDLDVARRTLERVPSPGRDRLVELLRYPEDTAGALMTNDVVWVTAGLTAAEARASLRERLREPDFVYFVYVIDDPGSCKLLGVLSLRDLLVLDDGRCLKDALSGSLEVIPALAPARLAARRVLDSSLAALPVVGDDGRLLGAITVDAAIQLLAPASWRAQAPTVFS